MSIYAVIDEGEPEFFSSNSGWSDIESWSEELDENEFPTIVHLCEHGYTEELDELRKELQLAIKSQPPAESVKKTLHELFDLIDDEDGLLMITSGMESGEDDDGDSDGNVVENQPPPDKSKLPPGMSLLHESAYVAAMETATEEERVKLLERAWENAWESYP